MYYNNSIIFCCQAALANNNAKEKRMKPVLKVILSLSLIAFFIVALGCGSPAGGGTSQITISISVNSAKAAGPVPIDLLRHVIVFSGPTGTQTHTITGSGTVKATVVAGLWNISVTAYDGDEVYATGAASAEVKAGRNTNVTVQMTLVGAEAAAAEAPYQALPNLEPDELFNNWTDLKNYIEGLEDLITPNNLVIERTIMLYDQGLIGGIKADDTINLQHGYYLPSGAEIRVTLVAPTNITTEISRGSSSLAAFDLQMFKLEARPGTKVTFSLGHPDYPQNSSLVLNGAGSATDSLITVTGGTTVLNMYRNVTLKNNHATIVGGGAVLIDDGTFNMYGGSITSNSSNSDGGGVYVDSASTFKMSGGSITDNYSDSDGGGVFVYDTGTAFEISGGTISGNKADLQGGGVYVGSGAVLSIKGGEIKNNQATQGGGVAIYNAAQFTMSGGTIGPGNIAEDISVESSGGGVYVSNTDFTMSGNAAIIGNIAQSSSVAGSWGGGVYSTNANFTMSGNAAIIGNTAISSTGPGTYGGGVYFGGTSTTFTMEAGTPAGTPKINGNTAEASTSAVGGGVYLSSGTTMTMNAGQINGNTVKGNNASTAGGGVYNPYGTFTKSNGEINGHDVTEMAPVSGKNAVFNYGSFVIAGSSGPGHAVVVSIGTHGRNATAGPTDSLDTAYTYPLGGWDF